MSASISPKEKKPTIARLLPLIAIAVGLLVYSGNPASLAIMLQLPETPKKPVTDEYHGVKVIDDYRWLEDFNDPAVRKWTEEQNRHTRAVLDQISARELIYKQLKELFNETSSNSYFSIQYCNGLLFALKLQPPNNQPYLITLKTANDPNSERMVVDPNRLNSKGTTSIDFYVPSNDGQLVAVSLSEGGSEEGTVHVYETATGKEFPDLIPRVNYPTGGGSVAWNADNSGFYYTRYPRGTERPKEELNFFQQVFFHKMGTPTSEDTYVIGKEFPKIAEIVLDMREDGRYLLVTVANGDGGEFAHYLLDPSGKWRQITKFSDKIQIVQFGSDNTLYLLSHNNAPHGKILRLALASADLAQARTVVEESPSVIQSFVFTATRIYTVDLLGGPSQMRIFDLEGRQQRLVPIRPVSSIFQVLPIHGDEILFYNTSFIDPGAWYRFDPSTGETTRTALFQTSTSDFSNIEVVREFAVSKDGTKVPINIIRRKGTKLDGQNPTILFGYGGYGISLTPSFSKSRHIWLDQGGVFAIANIRGGGEYGEEWHSAGNLTKKQNVFDDFTACAKYLIDTKYTNPARLAIEGGSNGGLLMGAVLTQHPDLFRAVVSFVGIYDMLRFELEPNGAFNVTEMGTVKNPEQFKALYAYSPYHHVLDGADYPAVLLLTGENDGRVDPANSRKMAARLQVATGSKRPVLLRTNSSGHGIGTELSEVLAQEADVYAFLFDQLGMAYRVAK